MSDHQAVRLPLRSVQILACDVGTAVFANRAILFPGRGSPSLPLEEMALSFAIFSQLCRCHIGTRSRPASAVGRATSLGFEPIGVSTHETLPRYDI